MKKLANIVIAYHEYGVITCEIECRNHFSVCFNEYEVYNKDEVLDDKEYIIEYICEYLEQGIEPWTQTFIEYNGVDLEDIANQIYEKMDCNAILEMMRPDTDFIHEVEFNDSEYLTDLVGCGQHDTRNIDGLIKIDAEVYDYIHELWDKYHLKEIPDDELEKLKDMIKDIPEAWDSMEHHMVEFLKIKNDNLDIAI